MEETPCGITNKPLLSLSLLLSLLLLLLLLLLLF